MTWQTLRAGILFSPLTLLLMAASLVAQSAPEESKLPAWHAQLSLAEQRALRGVVVMAYAEERCRELLGSYVPLEKLVEGCRTAGVIVTIGHSFDPQHDPDYDFRLSLRADGFEVAAAPKSRGSAEFRSDGKNVHAQSAGAAASEAEIFRERGAPLSELAAAFGLPAPPPRRRKVWTEENLGDVKGRVSVVGEGSSSEAAPAPAAGESASAESGQEIQFSRAEACGTVGINNIIGAEQLDCPGEAGRICSLEELQKKWAEPCIRQGIPPSQGCNLLEDDNYRYELTPRGGRFDVAAMPKRSGLGGFYCRNSGPGGYLTGERCFYNPRGAASPADTPVSESSMSGLSCVAGMTQK